jgi:hypothetical protein
VLVLTAPPPLLKAIIFAKLSEAVPALFWVELQCLSQTEREGKIRWNITLAAITGDLCSGPWDPLRRLVRHISTLLIRE